MCKIGTNVWEEFVSFILSTEEQMQWGYLVHDIGNEGPDQDFMCAIRNTHGCQKSCSFEAGYRKKLGLNTGHLFCDYITGLIFLP